MLLAENVTWYVARGGGIVAFALLTVSVLIGLGLSGRARLERWPRFALTDVHRFAGVLAGSFIGLHVLMLLLDDYMPFSIVDVVVPGVAGYRPLATAIGVVAAELLVAVALTNRFQKRLSYRFWRRMHYANFAVWLLALVHGITAGSDTASSWATALYGIAGASVAGLAAWRLLAASRPSGRPPRRAPAGPDRQSARLELSTPANSPIRRSETEAA
jgi:sulfoxide reductase heme-binding subunit YedZ